MNSPVSRSLQDSSALESIVQRMLGEAKKQGADQAEAAANHNIGLSTTARLGDVENLEYEPNIYPCKIPFVTRSRSLVATPSAS